MTTMSEKRPVKAAGAVMDPEQYQVIAVEAFRRGRAIIVRYQVEGEPWVEEHPVLPQRTLLYNAVKFVLDGAWRRRFGPKRPSVTVEVEPRRVAEAPASCAECGNLTCTCMAA